MNIYQKSRAKLLLTHTFFATIILSTPHKADPSIPTACTDGMTVWYNPQFVAGLSVDKAVFLWLHEAGHIICDHGSRLQGRHHEVWNHACDYAVNRMLDSAGLKIIPGGLLDSRFVGMSEDQIYEVLLKEAKKHQKAGGGQEPSDVMGQDVRAPADTSAEGRAKVRRSIQERVSQAASMARLSGKMTGELEKFVTDILNPVVPWQELLRDYMTRISKDDESWSRRNRRFDKVYLPSRWSQTMGLVGVIRDISGSITHEDQAKTVAEVESIAHSTRPESIHIVAADTKVKHEDVFSLGDTVRIEPMTGGGTDMRVPLDYMETLSPDVVVLITDGHTPWPAAEPNYPLIVCCTTDVEIPIGMVVRI